LEEAYLCSLFAGVIRSHGQPVLQETSGSVCDGNHR